MKRWEPSVPIVPLFRNEDSDSAHADVRARAMERIKAHGRTESETEVRWSLQMIG